MYHLTMLHVAITNTTSLSFSSEVASRTLFSIKLLKKGDMNINK